MPDTLMFAISNGDLPPLREWQRAIDALQPLVPVEFVRIEAGPEGGCAVRVGDKAISFTCAARTVGSVVSERHPEIQKQWSFAYGFRGLGGADGWISGATSAIARVTYASATDGALYHPDVGVFRDFTSGRNGIDAVFAHEFDALDRYRLRYPQEFEEPTGPMTLEVILRRRASG